MIDEQQVALVERLARLWNECLLVHVAAGMFVVFGIALICKPSIHVTVVEIVLSPTAFRVYKYYFNTKSD